MELLNVIIEQILSPPILFFVVGMFAALARSDLNIPKSMSTAMILFLLTAIGLRGGVGMAEAGIGAMLLPILVAIILSVSIVLLGYAILTKLKFNVSDAGAIAGHYGAADATTMVLGFAYLNRINVSYEAFMPVFHPLMGSSALIIAILLARRLALVKQKTSGAKINISAIIREIVLGKAVLILTTSIAIGYVSGAQGTVGIMPFFDDMFKGVLCLFMLDMGIFAANRLHEWKVIGHKLLVYALIMPPIHGIVGVLLGIWAGLSVGGATMLGVLAGSASFILAPAVIKTAIPNANPSLSLVSSIALTFPFNLIIGIPLYYTIALMLMG